MTQPPSLCDSCRLPGRCCSGFGLGVSHETALHALVFLATVGHGMSSGVPVKTDNADGAEYFQIGLPFMPFYQITDGTWRFWCPLLGRDGRCTDYDNRPALCRGFVPGSGPLCIEYTPDTKPHPGVLTKVPAAAE